MTAARTAAAARVLVTVGLLLLLARELLPAENLRASTYYACMQLCRRLAHSFGAAGIRAELAYRQAVADGSLAND